MRNFFKLSFREAGKGIVILAALGGIAAIAFAYSEPTSAPTGGTVYAPVNTGGTAQTKSGSLTVSGTLTGSPVVSGSYVSAPQYCIGGSCITSWPSGGGQWASSGSNIYNTNGGNVGIGTSWPGAKLDVSGGIMRVGRFYVADSQYGMYAPAIGTDGSNVAAVTNGSFYVINSGWGFANAYANDYWISSIGKWASSLGSGSFWAQSCCGNIYSTNPGSVQIGRIVIWQDSAGHIDGAYGGGIFFQGVNASIAPNGSFYSNGCKCFKINHPLDPENKSLIHASIEGPETAVYYRGEAQLQNGRAEVMLPAYFEALVRKDGRTVLLTNIDGGDVLWVATQDGAQVKDGKFVVKSSNPDSSQKFNWEAKAVRGDIDPLVIEVEKE